ncbi:MAG: hypothetical protein IJ001_02185 [Oscillospiraceae bacterium]|nr:hypothetical protein [Oscillospiraceae bacterium]
MRMNERIKKGLSGLLALTMVLSYVPLPAHAESGNLCDHHTEHTAECHYAEAVAGSPCTHAHSEDCYAIRTCLHECGTECEQGCTHECTVDNGCITMELDCHHTHGDCGWSEGTAEVPCGHVHGEICGYVEAVAGNPCANAETDPECDHSGDCGYVAAVEGQPCGHTEHTDCGYAPATEGTPCTHTHVVKVNSADSCYKLLCSHKDGGHDDACGYVAAVEAHECHYECAECVEALTADEITAPSTEATTEPSTEATEPATVCNCGTDDAAIHATTCPVYVAPETAVCYCAEKCSEPNIWCDICGFDYTKCGGTDTASVFEAEVSWVSNNGQSGTGTLSEAINALSDGGEVTLQSGFEMSDIQYITANIVLDLNGNYIDADLDPVFWLAGSGQITLTDTAGGGSISNQGGAVFQLEDDAKVTIEGGYMDGTDVIYAKENSTVTINGGEISGGYSGVLAEGNSKVTISGGSISGDYDIKISDGAAVSLVSDENGIGPTFPYGICVDGTTLNAILGEGAAYYLNGNQLDSVDNTATEITDGDVTVKAKCTHEITHVLNTADAAKHDEVCSKCGTWFSTDVHSGGTTTCTEKAVCTACGADYGPEPEGHSGGDGTATCIAGQICEKCGTPYGEVNADNHAVDTYTNGFYDCCGEYQAATDSDGDGCYEIGNAGQLYWFAQQVNGGNRTINATCTHPEDSITYSDNGDGTHKKVCTECGYVENAAEDHSTTADGDKAATCASKAYCSVCDSEYGEVDTTNHDTYVNGFCSNCDAYEPAVLNESGVYEISNAGQLYWFAEKVNSGETAISAVLTADIVVNTGVLESQSIGSFRKWTPIGISGKEYAGTFDGANHTISGLLCSEQYGSGIGLFGRVSGATIQNVGIEDSSFAAEGAVGGLVGYAVDAVIRNCYNAGRSYTTYGTGVGGILGAGTATISNCYNIGQVNGSNPITDGTATVTNCYYLSDTETEDGGKTAEQFASGEVAYLLGEPFGQNIDNGQAVQTVPVFSDAKVYQVTVTYCNGDTETGYSNTDSSISNAHHYAEPTFGWSADYTSCTAVFTCEICSTPESLACAMSVKTSDDGTQTVYSATVVKNGVTYTDTKTVDNEIISVNISWGSLNFTYTDGTGWNNPETAWVQVENTGNTAVSVTYTYETERTDITGSFFDGTSTVTAPVAIDAETNKKIWLRLDGQPSEALSNTTIGSVKLTIE